jgi:hypothetical protein
LKPRYRGALQKGAAGLITDSVRRRTLRWLMFGSEVWAVGAKTTIACAMAWSYSDSVNGCVTKRSDNWFCSQRRQIVESRMAAVIVA